LGCRMRTGTTICFVLFLAVLLNAGEKPRGDYYSDEKYRELKSGSLGRSNFYPDGNSGQLQLLIMCIDKGDAAVLSKLLIAVPNFANVCEHGSRSSPVHWTAFKGDTNTLAVLIASGADINKKGTNWKVTPLHLARDVATAEFLIAHGAEVEAASHWGQTPLIWHSRRGNLDIVKCLVRHGARINTKDENGRTALLCASEAARTNTVQFLEMNGARPLTEAERKALGPEMIAGNFSGAGAEHPFAESTLIYGTPTKWDEMQPVHIKEQPNGTEPIR
jgi:ankyrin repeat protein